MIKIINSKENSTYKYLWEIFCGKVNNKVLIYGDDLIYEAKASSKLESLIVYENEYIDEEMETIVLKENLFKNICSYKSLPKRIGVAHLNYSLPKRGDLIYLDGVQDPGNVGTIIRTALAFSYAGVVLSKDSANIYNTKVVQASKGAIFKIPVIKKDIFDLDLSNYEVIGTSLQGEDIKNYVPSRKERILVFGSEGQGMSEKVGNICTKKLLLPIKDIDSLNVASAASIFIYVLRRENGN